MGGCDKTRLAPFREPRIRPIGWSVVAKFVIFTFSGVKVLFQAFKTHSPPPLPPPEAAVWSGRIGQIFINICRGFGMRVVCYDKYPNQMIAWWWSHTPPLQWLVSFPRVTDRFWIGDPRGTEFEFAIGVDFLWPFCVRHAA